MRRKGYKIVQEIKTKGFAQAAAFSGISGKYLALGSVDDGYSVIRLGPFLGTDLVPLNLSSHQDFLPQWAMSEVLYRSGEGPSLLQRYMLEGSQESLRQAAHILKTYPDTINTFDRKTGEGCFDTALQSKKANLLKLVMSTVVDGSLEAGADGTRTIFTSEMPGNARSTLQSMIMNHAPDFTIDVLSQIAYVKVPFTGPREVSRTQKRVSVVPACILGVV